MNRAELASVLRTARSRIEPGDVGLPSGQRRQVPGLRREEVAQLAGLSVDYIVRLEQGRGPKPSAQVLGALTRALRFNDDDRDLVFRLSGCEPPHEGHVPMLVNSSALRAMDRISDRPVVVLSAKSDVLVWNSLAAALLGDFSEWPPARRNFLWQRFLGDGLDRVVRAAEEEADSAAHCVGCLRTAQARYPADPALVRLITELRTGSERFDDLWRAGRSGSIRATTATIDHPEFGLLTLDCDTLLVPDTDQTFVIYSAPPDTPEATALDLMRITGIERFTY
ncbi:helix-turn-helix transcriptional regulator [Nocardia sp. NBC_00416]|uniref:helix-turn-helix transcriptional regulator n=1 Tax=Nocardia sp. NBC_00416 TaxID=2975991 RepID=UPI002E20DF17